MKIIVLNGSPKGELSVTMQYVAFMQKQFPQHELTVLNIAQEIRRIEDDEQAFRKIMNAVKTADGILWAFPLYYLLVHSQYKRFIELIIERQVEGFFHGKHTALLSTSIHFFDHTAHNYMHGVCDDFGMKVYGSFSAGMDDLFKKEERDRLLAFCQDFFAAISRDAAVAEVYQPLIWNKTEYIPDSTIVSLDTRGRKLIIITDAMNEDINLERMVGKFNESLGGQTELINLHDLNIKGGCLGCMHCAYDNTCVYQGKDDFIEFFNRLKTADIIVFSGTIRDRYLSSLWKNFFDRSFFNTHIPCFTGKQIAFIVSGPLSQIPNLRQIFEAYTEIQGANLAGIVTDESNDSQTIDRLLRELATCGIHYSERNYIKPPSFFSVGGRKIFRDEIWGALRFPFAADHKYYQEKGLYDFPQKEYKVRLRNMIFGLLIRIPVIRKVVYGNKMIQQMSEHYKELLARI